MAPKRKATQEITTEIKEKTARRQTRKSSTLPMLTEVRSDVELEEGGRTSFGGSKRSAGNGIREVRSGPIQRAT